MERGVAEGKGVAARGCGVAAGSLVARDGVAGKGCVAPNGCVAAKGECVAANGCVAAGSHEPPLGVTFLREDFAPRGRGPKVRDGRVGGASPGVGSRVDCQEEEYDKNWFP